MNDATIKAILDSGKLGEPLSKDQVMSRSVSGNNVDYIEGHNVIRNANRIFNFDGWSYEVTSLILTPCPDNEKGNKVVSAQAIVKMFALGSWREDVGYGEGIARKIPAANESAGKQAVTDGLKRAARTFGDQFGNGLYDKRWDHVWEPDVDVGVLAEIKAAKTVKELERIYKTAPGGRTTYSKIISARKVDIQRGKA